MKHLQMIKVTVAVENTQQLTCRSPRCTGDAQAAARALGTADVSQWANLAAVLGVAITVDVPGTAMACMK
jgi:hypothetical protein